MSETSGYAPKDIESKWQAYWDKNDTFRTPEVKAGQETLYVLDMFPYPSGAGLHVGHPEGYTATDILCRAKRAQGCAVLHPMGWDAFGLPAEQHAIQTGTHPAVTTQQNIANFRRQLKMLGFSYDWSREVDTTDPEYVRWTQWIFLQLFRRGLAYQGEVSVNWCAALGTVLANEEVIDGKSERGGHPVVRTPLRQWVLRITQYADRLLEGLDDVEWPTSTRTMQREWIGRSEGAEIDFVVPGHGELRVFTTRPDTLFGATFLVIAPEHPLTLAIASAEQRKAIESYIAESKNRSDLDRQAAKEKTGVFTGAYAKHPLSGDDVPVWTSDYVLMGYGTGAIMAVPAHDTRDFEFAKRFALPIRQVIAPSGEQSELTEAYVGPGHVVNSGNFSGLSSEDAKAAMTTALSAAGLGKKRVEYKLRDWVFSRQRYWGEPFPIYFPVSCKGDPRDGDDYTIHYDEPIAVAESELPIRLPELDNFAPGDDPAGVLARAKDWRFFQRDGKWFARETNTMPQWAGSCWYYLRFCDPKNTQAAWSPEAAKTWLPVDLYVGGAEHAVLHLLYARFWHAVLYDEGLVPVREPFKKLVHQGMILGEIEFTDEAGQRYEAAEVVKQKDGSLSLARDATVRIDGRAHKMSKSRGNVVNPDDIVALFGADGLRVYEMFMGPLEATKPWNTESIHGVRRFLERCHRITVAAEENAPVSAELEKLTHRTIDKVTKDIDGLRFNTAVSAMMVLSSELAKAEPPPATLVRLLAQILHPFAPHLAEEMWQMLGGTASIQLATWPIAKAELLVDDVIEIPVQVNGKKRGSILLAKDGSEADARALAESDEVISRSLQGTIQKVVFVPGKILNFIVRP